MSFDPVGVVKAHPYATAGAVAGVLLVILIMSHRGSAPVAASAGVDPSATATQAAAAVTLSHDHVQMNGQNVQGAVQIATAQTAAASTVAGLQAGVQNHAADAAVTINQQNTQAAQAVATAQYGAAVQINQQNTGAAVQIDKQNTDAAVTINGQNTSAATHIVDSNNGAALMNSLIHSSGAAQEVAGLYETTLGRVPDTAGLQYWTDQLTSGNITTAGLISAFNGSAEHQAVLADPTLAAKNNQAILNGILGA